MTRLENIILSTLIHNDEYARKVLPFLQTEYFTDKIESRIISEISSFYTKYNKQPTAEVLRVQLVDRADINEGELKSGLQLIDEISKPVEVASDQWLIEQTEKFCKDKSLYNAILKSIKIIEGQDKQLSNDSIPSLLQTALSVSFDTAVGHSYNDSAEARYEFYTQKEERIPFDIEILNKVTKGGLPRKSLSMIVAESGGGKSLGLCHMSAAYKKQGKNVLYITMEMSEERIAERIDANLLNVDIDDLAKMTKDEFVSKIDRINSKAHGKLIIKEYPTSSAHSGHFRGLLEELRIKKNFIPDIVVVDYLGICASSKMKQGGSVNSYTYIKSISEELRALAVEYNVPVLTAMQVNRSGFGNSELELTSISESIGVVMTCDFVMSMIRTQELDDLDQTMIKILKNRYGDLAAYRKFVVGINRARMKLYDVEPSAQKGLSDSGQPQQKDYRPKKAEPDIPLFDKSKTTPNFGGFKF
jgi:replicative DNA helicase